MEKSKKKTIEQSGVRKGSPMKGVGSMAGRIYGKVSSKFREEKK